MTAAPEHVLVLYQASALTRRCRMWRGAFEGADAKSCGLSRREQRRLLADGAA